MCDYINRGFYLLGGIIIVASIILIMLRIAEAKDKKEPLNIWFPVITILILIASVCMSSIYTKKAIDTNISYFNNNKTLECSSGFKTVLVSKKRGWQKVKKDCFTKNDLVIRADNCSNIKLQN